jgi:hypothetical protein
VGDNRPDFDGTVKEHAARITFPSGRELLSHDLGCVIVEDSPNRGQVRQGPLADEL